MSLAETRTEDFVISRVLDAPRGLVWKCFTDPEHMNQWWGPKGATVTVSKMELRPGGTFHYRMETADGAEIWGKMLYREITPRDRIHHAKSASADTLKTSDGARRRKASAPARASGRRRR